MEENRNSATMNMLVACDTPSFMRLRPKKHQLIAKSFTNFTYIPLHDSPKLSIRVYFGMCLPKNLIIRQSLSALSHSMCSCFAERN